MKLDESRSHHVDPASHASPKLELELDATHSALLEEALRLTDAPDQASVLRLALKELVERQRFLRWVALHERQ